MFTGIVTATGTVERIEKSGGDVRLTIYSDDMPWQNYAVGESISVNGACLTAVSLASTGFTADVSQETLNVTGLSDLAVGGRVNLEPSLAVGDRIGGHFVSGHVDCVGVITSLESDARSIRAGIEIPKNYLRYTAKKGSICVDGVSLTINTVSGSGVGVNIIPHTAEVTIIRDYCVGTRVNVEVDLLARYLERLLSDTESTG